MDSFPVTHPIVRPSHSTSPFGMTMQSSKADVISFGGVLVMPIYVPSGGGAILVLALWLATLW